MAFWSDKSVEPKRKFRWLLYWTGVPQFVIKSVKKPSYSVATTPHQFLNYEFNYPGRVTWEDIQITLVDPVQPDSTKSLYKILENSGYVIPSNYQEAAAATISKEGMVDALGTEIKLSQLDYSSDELLNITVNIKYDYATIDRLPQGKIESGIEGIWTFNKTGFNPPG